MHTSATTALRRLPRAALIYGLGDLAPKALYFLLLPWYLRHLSPGEFGIVALASTFSTLLGFMLQLNLNGSVFRYYFDYAGENRQRSFVGTVLLFQVGWTVVVVVTLQLFGGPIANRLTALPFDPYLRLGTWLAVTASLPVVPLAVLQMRHEAGLYRTLTFFGFLLSTAAMAWLVVWSGRGAYGFLMGQVLGGVIMLAAYALVIVPRMEIAFVSSILRECLVFSLPLIPYAVGGWVMDMSNRYLVHRFLSLGDVGRYNVAYQFALVVQAALNAFALAWLPVFYRLVREDRAPDRLARFGKLYWCSTLLLGLGVAVLARDALMAFTDREYQASYPVVPVLVATQVLTCLWHLVVNPLFLVRKTGYLPGAMAVSAALSVGLNVLLIPAFGLVGGALAVLLANLALIGITGTISLRLYPVPYSYGRMTLAVVAAALTFFLAGRLQLSSPAATVILKVVALGAYPLLLLGFGVLRRGELREIWLFLRQSPLFANSEG